MSKQTYRIVEVTVQAGQTAQTKTLKGNLSQGKATAMRDKLEDKLGDFDPSKPLVSYLIEPAN